MVGAPAQAKATLCMLQHKQEGQVQWPDPALQSTRATGGLRESPAPYSSCTVPGQAAELGVSSLWAEPRRCMSSS